jgi:hypothetical protein
VPLKSFKKIKIAPCREHSPEKKEEFCHFNDNELIFAKYNLQLQLNGVTLSPLHIFMQRTNYLYL